MFKNKNLIIACLSVALLFAIGICIVLFVKLDDKNFDSIEVERKFIVSADNFPSEIQDATIYEMVQTYISFSPEMRVRKTNDLYYYYTIKLPKDNVGLAREEIEIAITKDEYESLLEKKVGNTIFKTRYQFTINKYKYEIDVYSGDLAGLSVCEIEFKNTKEANKFKAPSWLGLDVTSDLRYKNANLAKDGMPIS